MLAVVLALKVLDTVQTMAGFFNWPFQFDECRKHDRRRDAAARPGRGYLGKLTPEQFIAAPYPPLYYLLNLPFSISAPPSSRAARSRCWRRWRGAG